MRHVTSFLCISVMLLLAVMLIGTQASAATFLIGSSQNWSAIAGGPPTAADSVRISTGSTLTVNVSNAVCLAISIGGNTGNGALAFNAASQLTATRVWVGGTGTGIGTLTMTSGGTLIAGSITTRGGTPVFTRGTGTIQLTANNTLPAATAFNNYTNLVINGGTTTLGQTTTVNGTCTLTSGTLAVSTNTLNLSSTVTQTSGTITSSATGTVNYNGTGAQTVASGTYGNLTISGTRTTNSVTLASTGTIGIAGTFTNSASFTSGGFINTGSTVNFNGTGAQTIIAFNYNNLTLSGARTTNNITLVNGGTVGIAGTFSPSASFSSGNYVVTGNTVNYNGSGAQSAAGFTYNNLTAGHSISLSGNATVNGTLALGANTVTTSANTLTLGSAGATTRTTGFVIGNLARVYSATGSKTFDVGTTGEYTPVTVNATAGTGTFTVSASHGSPAGVANPAKTLTHSWSLTSAGITTATLAFTWVAGDVPGTMTASAAVAGRTSNPGVVPWSQLGGAVVGSTGTIVGVTTFSSWTWGESGALPIQLASLSSALIQNNVRIDWTTVSETNNYGFYVERRASGQTSFSALPNSFVPGNGTTLEQHAYSFTDQNVPSGSYSYRLKQVDLDGLESYSSPIDVVINKATGVKEESTPAVFKLNQNYPNPFNPSTNITFSVAETHPTTLKIYTLLGEEIATLFNGVATAGKLYTAHFDASNLGNGIYFYRIESGANVVVRKMSLLK